jgi:putative membrane protein
MLRTFLNGLAFGITQIVPGVSGGTIAVILGFYNQFIETLNNFTKDFRRRLRFLIPFMAGVALGIIAFSSFINYLLVNFSLPAMSFFIGMITGIIPLIYIKLFTGRNGAPQIIKRAVLIIIPALLLVFISHFKSPPPADTINIIGVPFMIFIFFAGLVAAAALITPGISGSFILLLFGVYHIVIDSLSSIRHLLTDIANIQLWLDICKVLAPFAIGVIIGVFSMAKLIEKLLKNYSAAVYSVILGLLTGSVYALFNEPITFQSGVSAAGVIISAATFLSGFAVSFFLSRKRQI